MEVNTLPQVLSLIVLVGAAFGWGVTMNKKQDKVNCEINNNALYKLIRDVQESMNGLKIEITKLNGKIESLEAQVALLSRVEAILESHRHNTKRDT